MSRFLSSCAVGCLLLVAAAPASAQAPRPERPYRGLFGSGTGETSQLLTASASLASGYDDDLLADARGSNSVGSPGREQIAGIATNVSGSLAYTLKVDGMSLAVNAGTSGRYYPSARQEFLRASQGSVALSIPLRERLGFTAGASVVHQPYVLASIFPAVVEPALGEPVLPDLDIAPGVESYLAYEGHAGVSQRLSRRTSLAANYSYRQSTSPLEDGDFRYQSGGAGLTHTVGRGVNLRLGYAYGEARYPDGRQVPHHQIDGGVDYSRSLSISRRTNLSFGTGTSATSGNETLHLRLTGNARLTHEIGRTWSAFAGYGRNVRFHETWSAPVLADAVTAGLGGLITRRLQFTSALQAGFGTVGVQRDAPGFRSYVGSASLGYALTRFMSAGVTYLYYQHRFDDGVLLPSGSPRRFDRQSVRASISLWAPIFQRSRRANASR